MIQIKSWQADGTDYRGKDQPRVYRILMNGQERDVSKADLIRAVEMNLPLTQEAVNGHAAT